MKLSISNIAWTAENDSEIYAIMKKYGYEGLEIAPTRIFPEAPYDNIENARCWSQELKKKYGFVISSMQSIWFGRQEAIFGTDEERRILLDYTKKAIDFAAAIGCGNLVFGCPKNRNMPDGANESFAIEFFRSIGNYAAEKGSVIGMEANPTIYNTNYINSTEQALELISRVNSTGFRLNLDVGTMIRNGENVGILKGKVRLINHVHISEPYLKPICERFIHKELLRILAEENYMGFVSIEMGKTDDIAEISKSMEYIRAIADSTL
ncbi:MAG: sugar phosphate isomerase/epimerase [Oscillospiraceae bacterium]|nr:sugar phosphate isomerase/epimerase [Oscillospiraceae bacterium]